MQSWRPTTTQLLICTATLLLTGTAVTWYVTSYMKKKQDESDVDSASQGAQQGVSSDETAQSADSATRDKAAPPSAANSSFSFKDLGKPEPVKTAPKKATANPEAQTLSNKGTSFYKKSDYKKAIEHYSQALDLWGKESIKDVAAMKIAYNNRAAAFGKLEQHEKVVDDCTRALELDSKYHKVRSRRANAYINLGKDREALHDFTAVWKTLQEKQPPSEDKVTEKHMEELLQKIGKSEAKQILASREGVFVFPSTAFVTSYLSTFRNSPCVSVEGNVSADSDIPDGTDTEKAKFFFRRGLAAKKTKQFQAAAKDFEQATSLGEGDPEYALMLNQWGTFLHLQGDLKGANKALTKSSGIEPKCVNTWIKLAGLAFDMEDRESALKHFAHALSIDGSNSDIFFHRGQMFLIMEELEKSIADLKQCISMAPDFALAYMQLGIAQFRMNDFDQASASCKKAVDLAPHLPQVHNYYGEVLLNQGKGAEAKKSFEKASEIDPVFPDPVVNQGLLLLNTAPPNVEGALGLFDKAIQIDPQCQTAYIHRAQVLFQMQQYEKSLSEYETAIKWSKTEAELSEICAFREAALAQMEAAKVV